MKNLHFGLKLEKLKVVKAKKRFPNFLNIKLHDAK